MTRERPGLGECCCEPRRVSGRALASVARERRRVSGRALTIVAREPQRVSGRALASVAREPRRVSGRAVVGYWCGEDSVADRFSDFRFPIPLPDSNERFRTE